MEILWNVVGASATGTAHAKTGAPCQDRHASRTLENGVVILGVADGAGSAERSGEGAEGALHAGMAALETGLATGLPTDQEAWEALLTEAFSQARQAVVELAGRENQPLRDFSTTLTLALAGPAWLVTGQIGDSVVVAQTETGELFTATEPQQGEYAGETFFLTMDNALDLVAGRVYPQGVRALAALTDGLLRLALTLPGNQPHAPFFTPLIAFCAATTDSAAAAAHLEGFLNSPRIAARTDDDKTLLLAARPAPPAPPPSA